MKGFDPHYQDFPDYILKITKEIWEDRGVSTLHQYYAPDIVVRSPSGITLGNQAVIGATLATLAEFPDRELLGEDVIWSGTPETGMLSSHRILSTATHLGDGQYGQASQRKLKYRVIADCHAINNQIDDEWLIRDSGAIVRQLGTTPGAFALAQIEHEGGVSRCAIPFRPTIDVAGPYQGQGNQSEWGQRYAQTLQRIMAADMTTIKRSYDRACQGEYPGGMSANGWAAVESFWLPLRSAMPDARFEIAHCIGNEGGLMPPRAAIRWSLSGKHTGPGLFGQASGTDLYVMGICHAEFGPWGIRREFALIDEVAIWKQIHLHNSKSSSSSTS